MKYQKKMVSILSILGFIILCIVGSVRSRKKAEYITAVHYFADEWPINFWNSEWDSVDKDLEGIKQDGFNTVIIVVPWREFQPGTEPIVYNQYAFSRLEHFLGIAQEHELMVQVRLGYMNDYFGESDPAERYYDIVGNNQLLDAWLDYAKKIYQICSKYSFFAGGFITWEDFWHNYALVDYIGGTEHAYDMSLKSGFPEYISKKYSLVEFNQKFLTNFHSFYEIYVPDRSEAWADEWFCFIDDFMIRLLSRTNKYFPKLFMEVRTDNDVVGTRNGKLKPISHESTWECGESVFMAMMYKPSQGAEATGPDGQVTAKEAWLNMEKWFLHIIKRNGGKMIYLDQFLFVDNTPGYQNGRLVKDDEVAEYLAGCDKILKKYTNGYGIWVYRDYCNNMLYNPQFVLALKGWDSHGQVTSSKLNGSKALKLSEGARISQKIPAWRKMEHGGFWFSMDYSSKEKGIICVKLGLQEKRIEIDGCGTLQLYFQDDDYLSLQIQAEIEVDVDNVKVYNFIQTQDMYGIDGQELAAAEAIRSLNIKCLE